MSFGFGASSTFPSTSGTLGFGTTSTTKPTGFGTSFFGGSTTTAPSFGLGTTPATTATGFTGFGTAPATTATGFTGFGTAPATSATGFTGFGTAPAGTSGFSFGGFGAKTTATTAPTGFGGFSGFGTTSTAPSTGFSGFSGFGTAPAAGTTSTAGTGLFSGFGQTTAPSTGFGAFGAKPGTSFSFGAGGLSTPAFGLQQSTTGLGGLNFGGQQTAQQQPAADPNQAMYNSVFNCQVFGDERDRTLNQWNLVQALWGVGKGYYSQQAPPVDYDLKNPLCRFKAISYSMKPSIDYKDGLVALVFNKKESEIRALESQLLTNLIGILGNKPNLSPVVESIRPLSDSKTIVLIYVQEKSATGSVTRITASDLSAYLLQPMQKQQLSNLHVDNVYSHVDPGQDQLKEYLDNPPAGIDARTWKTAQDENPMPDRLIPVPLLGFAEVRWRIKCQEAETELHQAFLDKMADEITDLQRKHTATLSKIQEYKTRFSQLQHRILKVLIVQQISRKMGLSLLPEEERLKTRLEALSATVTSNSFKARLSELSEGVKQYTEISKEPQKYKVDSSVITEIKQLLTMEQSGMTHMISTIQADLADLKIIKDGMVRIIQGPL